MTESDIDWSARAIKMKQEKYAASRGVKQEMKFHRWSFYKRDYTTFLALMHRHHLLVIIKLYGEATKKHQWEYTKADLKDHRNFARLKRAEKRAALYDLYFEAMEVTMEQRPDRRHSIWIESAGDFLKKLDGKRTHVKAIKRRWAIKKEYEELEAYLYWEQRQMEGLSAKCDAMESEMGISRKAKNTIKSGS